MSTAFKRPKQRDHSQRPRRILIVGVSSYIGSALAVALKDEYEVFGTYLKSPIRIDGVNTLQLDCFDGAKILEDSKRYAPEAIIYCAGFNDKQTCQQEKSRAEAINFKAPAIFFKLLPSSTRFIYFSTDEIFGGPIKVPKPYLESGEISPQSVWAKTKYAGENLVISHKRYTATFRLGKLFGECFGDPTYQKKNWIDEIREALAKKEKVIGYNNLIRSYCYIGDVTRAVRHYLQKHDVPPVLYNLGSPEALSHYDFLKIFAETFDFDTSLIVSKEYEYAPAREKFPEPTYSALNSSKIFEDYNFKVQSSKEAVEEMKERLRTGWTKGWAL